MSTTESTELDDDSPVHPGEHHTHGPSDKQYFTIFWVLVVLTALEISTEWWPDGTRDIAVPVLLILMGIKFVLIASYFMHLKWDPSLLKRVFYFGLAVAVAVYIIALSAMNFWTDSGTTQFDDPPPVPPPPFCTGADCPSG